MRIMIGPIEIAGIAAGLSSGFERIGMQAEVVVGLPHPFRYGAQARLTVPAVWIGLGRLVIRSLSKPRPLRIVVSLPWKAWSLIVWIWALFRYDAFIFLFGQTITNSAFEARLYRRLGKKVVMIYCGSDIRPPYIDGPRCNHFKLDGIERLARISRQIKARVRLHEQSDFICVSTSVISQFQTKPYVDWFAMGIPLARCPLEPKGEEADDGEDRPLRILHSPSDPDAKGTAVIVAIIDKLKNEGQPIDLVLLKGVPNKVVQAELERCDFVVDQCWSDTPMGGFAAEAALHGKPAIVAGYAATLDAVQSSTAATPVTYYVHPDELEQAVRRLVADKSLRTTLGERARAFVCTHWSAEQVAGKYLALLEGRITPANVVTPGGPAYVHGAGLSEKRARVFVRTLIDRHGVAALQLRDRPDLERAFVKFANGEAAETSVS